MKFTETGLRNLKPPRDGKRRDYTETGRPGFMLRVTQAGTKSFVFRFTRNGRTEIMTIGTWPSMSLAEAHEEHAAARKTFVRGLDPKVERERAVAAAAVTAKKEDADRAVTVRNVLSEWAWFYARRNRKRPREAVRLLKVYVATPWKGRPVRDLVKRDAVLLLDRIVARGAKVTANRIYNLGMQVFNFAIKRDLITNNPFLGIGRPGGDEHPRERTLNREEISTFWRALDDPNITMARSIRLALKLILVTAQRPGEVAGAALDEIDVKAARWTIPATRAKNDKIHVVPLTPLALEIIEELCALAQGRPHLLPSAHRELKRDEPLSQHALARALRNNREGGKLFGAPLFTPHDLRRSAASMMTSLGVPRLHVGKVLNHSESDITSVYDRHDYLAEKVRALQVWDDELRAIIGGEKGKVMPLRRGKAA